MDKTQKWGIGVDFHILKKEGILLLGGVKISDKFGAVGDSDADTVLHSIADALLAATGKGDIGTYFYRKKGIKSSEIVEYILTKFVKNKYSIKQVQIIILLQSPPLLRKKELIRKSVARILNIQKENVNIQAKTFQGLLNNIVASICFVVLEALS